MTIQTLTQRIKTSATLAAPLSATPRFVAGIGWLAVNASGAVCFAMTAARCARIVAWTSK